MMINGQKEGVGKGDRDVEIEVDVCWSSLGLMLPE